MKKFHTKRLDSVSIITNEKFRTKRLDSVSIITNEKIPLKKGEIQSQL